MKTVDPLVRTRNMHDHFRTGIVALYGLLLSSMWIGAAKAASPTQVVQLTDLKQSHPFAFPVAVPNLNDPSLFLPEISQRVSRLILRLSERRLYAYQGDRLITAYPVAVGRDDWETPVGEFTIFQRQQHPTWENPLTGVIVPPGPDNPLGARWLGFWTDGINFIGFHGTPDEDLIGQAVSHGCVRMRDADVIELYEKVDIGTQVVVLP